MNQTVVKSNEKPVAVWRVWGPLTLSLLAFWLIMVEGQLNGLWFAVPVVAMALLVRRVMPIPIALRNVSIVHFIAFVPYFLWQSLIGGIDVTWRAFHPKLPVFPNIYAYSYRLRSEGARVFMAQIISLMPGTLACLVGEHRLIVHVLSEPRKKFVSETAVLEEKVARIFREKLEAPHG